MAGGICGKLVLYGANLPMFMKIQGFCAEKIVRNRCGYATITAFSQYRDWLYVKGQWSSTYHQALGDRRHRDDASWAHHSFSPGTGCLISVQNSSSGIHHRSNRSCGLDWSPSQRCMSKVCQSAWRMAASDSRLGEAALPIRNRWLRESPQRSAVAVDCLPLRVPESIARSWGELGPGWDHSVISIQAIHGDGDDWYLIHFLRLPANLWVNSWG